MTFMGYEIIIGLCVILMTLEKGRCYFKIQQGHQITKMLLLHFNAKQGEK